MSDDIREVMKPTSYSPLKPAGKSGGHSDGGPRHYDEGGDEEEGGGGEFTPEEMEKLRAEVEAANARLETAGRKVQIDIVGTASAPLIEITLPEADGGEQVRRRVEAHELSEWVLRLESGEGLIIDETF